MCYLHQRARELSKIVQRELNATNTADNDIALIASIHADGAPSCSGHEGIASVNLRPHLHYQSPTSSRSNAMSSRSSCGESWMSSVCMYRRKSPSCTCRSSRRPPLREPYTASTTVCCRIVPMISTATQGRRRPPRRPTGRCRLPPSRRRGRC